jgi:hypothetical protein
MHAHLAVHFDILHAGHGCGGFLDVYSSLRGAVGRFAGLWCLWVAKLPTCNKRSDGRIVYSDDVLQRAGIRDGQIITGACGSPEADKLHGWLAASWEHRIGRCLADGDTFVPSETESLVAAKTSRAGLEWR